MKYEEFKEDEQEDEAIHKLQDCTYEPKECVQAQVTLKYTRKEGYLMRVVGVKSQFIGFIEQ